MTMILFKDCKQLVTCAPLLEKTVFGKLSYEDLGVIENAWFVTDGTKILDLGESLVPKRYLTDPAITVKSLKDCLVMPGLVDSHTHPLYAGSRALEFCQRIDGLSYEEIANQGGGINVSVEAAIACDDDKLLNLAAQRLRTFLSYGVTTLEMKSGYGLSVEEELRHLSILQKLKLSSKQTLKVTCLGLHAIPKGENADAFVEQITHFLLPEVHNKKLACAVDIFIESGYFSKEHARTYLTKAAELGFDIHVHADEFSNSGGSQIAAEFKALSADHLQHASPSDLRKLAENGVVATILPGTSLYTKIPFVDTRPILEAGCIVAVASDHNPGSCTLQNLPLIASLAGVHCYLPVPNIIAGVTYFGAKALKLEASKGALSPGYDADFLIHPCSTLKNWVADMGQTKPREVWIRGEKQV